MPKVTILMATYNGIKYISEQLNSIKNQTLSNWELIVRDDGSKDGTKEYMEGQSQLDKRITILEDKFGPTGSPQKNFARLLDHVAKSSTANYIFFTDQDDVWLPNKLENFLNVAQNVKSPCLVHSDLTVVDSTLNVINPSFFSQMGLPRNSSKGILYYAFQNNVTGCACMFSSSLLKSATPVPERVLMHDWWLAMVTSINGTIEFYPESTVCYRQHDKNSVGAFNFKNITSTFKIISKIIKNAASNIISCYESIYVLSSRSENANKDKMMNKLLQSARYSRVRRLFFLIKLGCLPQNFSHQVAFVLRHLLTSSKALKKYAK